MVQPVPSVNHAGPNSPLTTDAEPSAPSRLQAAIEGGRALGKLALYFGCWDRPGHYLHRPGGEVLWQPKGNLPGGFPWSMNLMDCGLLRNGRREDVCDGRVYSTCGGQHAFWYAFFWWDRSGDKRGASNSGLYVRGFGWPEAQAAFDYGLAAFPHIAARQQHPLVLQGARSIAASRAAPGETVEGDVRPPETPVVGDVLNPDLGEER